MSGDDETPVVRVHLLVVGVGLLCAMTAVWVSKHHWNPAHIRTAATVAVLHDFDRAGVAMNGKAEFRYDPQSHQWRLVGRQRETIILRDGFARGVTEEVGYDLDGRTTCDPLSPSCNKIENFRGSIVRTVALLH